MNYVKTLNEFNSISEAFEVHYSDGVRAMKKFNNQSQAISFAKDLIKNKKGLQFVDVFNAGSGFHSTADTDAIVAFWGDGSYTDNVAKKDPKLAAKKIEEAVELDEKKADGTISDDEQEREDDLMANVESTIDELIAKIKKEAHDIGGSFRAPGIESRVAKLIKEKLHKAKLA